MWLGHTAMPGVFLSVTQSNVDLWNETVHRPAKAFKPRDWRRHVDHGWLMAAQRRDWMLGE